MKLPKQLGHQYGIFSHDDFFSIQVFFYFTAAQVTVLLPCFSDAEMASPTESIRQVLENINRYNRRFSGEPLTVILLKLRELSQQVLIYKHPYALYQ